VGPTASLGDAAQNLNLQSSLIQPVVKLLEWNSGVILADRVRVLVNGNAYLSNEQFNYMNAMKLSTVLLSRACVTSKTGF
jgi:hypothetical protein